jgi:hypothetical protein
MPVDDLVSAIVSEETGFATWLTPNSQPEQLLGPFFIP